LQPTDAVTPAPMPTAPAPPRGPPEPPSAARRLFSAAFAVTAAILAGISAFTVWWTFSIPSSGVVLDFRPGEYFYAFQVMSNISLRIPFASAGYGPLEGLYVALLALALGLLVFGLLVGGLMVVSALGKLRNPAAHTTLRNLAVVLVVVAVFALAVAPSLQPTLAGRSSPGLIDLCTLSNNTSQTPCNSFWGTGVGSSGPVAWGGNVGWYLMLVAALFFLVSLVTWLPRRPKAVVSPVPAAVVPAPVG
jgi:hypothetical protein